jgi:hypothetical protein
MGIAGSVLTIGCGYTDGGGGTRTLRVVAELSYSAHDNETDVHITVEKDGVTVDNAIVEVKDSDSELAWLVTQGNPREEYTRIGDDHHIDGYHRWVELSVEADADRLDAQLEGPGKHKVVSPDNNDVLAIDDLGDDLEVAWETSDGLTAQEVVINLGDHSHTITKWEDPGSYDVPTSGLEPGEESVRVTRRNKIRLDGGTTGSLLTVEYEARNSFVLQ